MTHITTTCSSSGAAAAAYSPPSAGEATANYHVTGTFDTIAPAVTKEAETVSSEADAALRQEENELAIVKALRASDEWEEVVAYGYLSESARAHSLTATTLRGENKILRLPLKFFNKEKTECTIVAHLGANLCGHDGIIHGGLIATLLDEHLAYVTIPHLPNYLGFTANLNIDYRLPVKSSQWVAVRGKLDNLEGRKAWADAWITPADSDTRLAEARALYVSPRTAGPRTDF